MTGVQTCALPIWIDHPLEPSNANTIFDVSLSSNDLYDALIPYNNSEEDLCLAIESIDNIELEEENSIDLSSAMTKNVCPYNLLTQGTLLKNAELPIPSEEYYEVYPNDGNKGKTKVGKSARRKRGGWHSPSA